MALELRSMAFPAEGTIPRRHTCDGEDVSPPLSWTGAPSEVRSYALVCEDPDAPVGTWVHWVAYGLPASAGELPEAVPAREVTPAGWKQGRNDFRRIGYGGPCPPAGPPHRYFFRVYALDEDPQLKPGVEKRELMDRIEGHVLAEAELMGTYGRGGRGEG